MHRIDQINRERATAVLIDFCHTKLRIQEEKNILGTSLEKSKTTHVTKNPILSYLGQNSEMQNSQD